ncbi:MAG: FtsH protease activity modulator HflK [Chitinivibrionales bacterium]|nr:FtsH protease activity modulator HflK [Chitinivibrionales bacterium]MBD3356247.1 FtsH protease activity modulator HflK [Chitinivibrionales bacterium]
MNMQSDPNEVLNQVASKMRRKFAGKTGLLLGVVAAVAAVVWIVLTGWFTVGVNEQAIIQRFGKYNRVVGPGLHFKLPEGIEHKTKVKVKKVYTEEFGFRTVRAGVQTDYAPEERYTEESLMLTGDLNCAVVPWLVQYRISNPRDYLFRVRDVQGTLRDLSEAVMREVVGDRSINEVISDRLTIADTSKVLLQQALDEASTGLTVVSVELKNTNVPKPVQSSFNEVNQALQQKERMIYEAREEYNKAIPSARGEAEKIVSEAEGYALDRVNKAQGDSSRFVALYQEYAKSRDVTRRRMYIEALREVLPKLGSKYIVDSDQNGPLPLLDVGRKGGK